VNTQRVLSGRYELGELIGRGGMADVFRGLDTRLGRTVAVKLLRPDLARDRSRARQGGVRWPEPSSIVAIEDTDRYPLVHEDTVRCRISS
jgi:serine/threonine-protein kinase